MTKTARNSRATNLDLYKNVIDIDEKTGEPADFDSLVAGYPNLVWSSGLRAGIVAQEIPDAMQEVLLKFYKKNGMEFYDASTEHKFASMFRSWTTMFMLQERDKVKRHHSHYLCLDSESVDYDSVEPNFVEEVESNVVINEWLHKAEVALTEQGNQYLVPLLHRCFEAAERNKVVTRADVIEVLGVRLNKATEQLQALQAALTEAGLGAQSLHELA